MKGEFTLEDFLNQLQSVKQMGPIGKLLEMIPGMGKARKDAQAEDDDNFLWDVNLFAEDIELDEDETYALRFSAKARGPSCASSLA